MSLSNPSEPDASHIYCTTYCNRGHRISDGKPVSHECYVIPPIALKAEMDGDTERAIEFIEAAKKLGKWRIHRGVKP